MVSVPDSAPTLVGIAVVTHKLGLSRASVYRLMRSDPMCPRAVHIGRSARWFLTEIDEYLRYLANKRGPRPAGGAR